MYVCVYPCVRQNQRTEKKRENNDAEWLRSTLLLHHSRRLALQSVRRALRHRDSFVRIERDSPAAERCTEIRTAKAPGVRSDTESPLSAPEEGEHHSPGAAGDRPDSPKGGDTMLTLTFSPA